MKTSHLSLIALIDLYGGVREHIGWLDKTVDDITNDGGESYSSAVKDRTREDNKASQIREAIRKRLDGK
jgi:hypothetical protein